MFIYEILYLLIFIKKITLEPLNDFPRWNSKSKPEKISQYKSILEYLRIGNSQSIENNCQEFPNYPNKRAYHISITYKTYSQQEANELCPSNYCGPFCNYTSENCLSKKNYSNYLIPHLFELINFTSPSSPGCPPHCCSINDEFCYRLINNAGNEIFPDQEKMIIFGGLVLNKIKFEINNKEKNILLNCEEIIEGLENIISGNLTYDENINLSYLINNCGYDLTNELWEYNIQNDSWLYLKPEIDINNNIQQKPYPRYGHAGIYIEKIDEELNFTRKYLVIYGGYSLYCQHSCEDMWFYEISYGPQRFYPIKNNNIWEKGNKWKKINLLNSPGKRVLHSMTVDNEFKYIYLFGGYSFDEHTNKNILMDDLWRYNINQNIWEKLNTNGIYSITRLITYWDGSSTLININPIDCDLKTDTIRTTLKYNNISNNTIIGYFPIKRSASTLSYNKKENGVDYLLLFGGLTYNSSNSYNIQYLLNDLWIYNISNNLWKEIFPKDEKPEARYGHQILQIEEDTFILYGGIGYDKFHNDLWLFKAWKNIWKEINKEKINLYPDFDKKEKWPYSSGFFTMNFFKEGIIIYGGIIWKQKKDNLTFYKNYSDEEEPLLNSSLINTLENLYILYFNKCDNNCNNNGICHLGICICNDNFWGHNCKNKKCPKSLCFFDDVFHIKKQCIHCSGNGECLENGKCECNNEYIGEDCSIAGCLNNCSGEKFGKCVIKKPVSQCECNQELKRGGDDCSLIFCLNNCGNEGTCNVNNGECDCPNNYYGIDCSIYVISFREKGCFIIANIKIFILFFIFLIFI